MDEKVPFLEVEAAKNPMQEPSFPTNQGSMAYIRSYGEYISRYEQDERYLKRERNNRKGTQEYGISGAGRSPILKKFQLQRGNEFD